MFFVNAIYSCLTLIWIYDWLIFGTLLPENKYKDLETHREYNHE